MHLCSCGTGIKTRKKKCYHCRTYKTTHREMWADLVDSFLTLQGEQDWVTPKRWSNRFSITLAAARRKLARMKKQLLSRGYTYITRQVGSELGVKIM